MLNDTEAAILDLERGWYKFAGAKETEIHARFGWTAARYYAALGVLIDRPDAEAHDAATVRRLRRIRDARRAVR